MSFKDIVRVVLSGKHSPDVYPDTDTIKHRYQDRFYHFEIKDESGIAINPDDYVYDKSLKGEFIRLVTEKVKNEEERERIIACGLAALLGGEMP